jgi:hypothetical protein
LVTSAAVAAPGNSMDAIMAAPQSSSFFVISSSRSKLLLLDP